MKAHLAKTAIGEFAFDDSKKLIFYRLFSNPKDAYTKFGGGFTKEFLIYLEEYEKSEDEFARKLARRKMREYSITFGLCKNDEEFNEYMSSFGMSASSSRLKRIITKDLVIVQASNSLESLNKFLNILTEHFKEWFWLNYPEHRGENESIIRNIIKHGARENFPDYTGSYGIDFDEKDRKVIREFAQEIEHLMELKKSKEAYLKQLAKEVAPNISGLVGEIMASRLIASAGSLEKLAQMPASTLQLLGAEKALFRHLRNRNAKPPKYGMLYESSYVNNAPFEKKGKVARIVASQLSKAAKIDFYSKRDDSKKMKDEMESDIRRELGDFNEGKREFSEIFSGVFGIGNDVLTLNSAPGTKVYGERLVIFSGKEYRVWDPRRSKLGAAISNGLKNMPIKPGSKILYLGSSTGTTVSHVSDILGPAGSVYSVEFAERVFREFLKVAGSRTNIIPILADARKLNDYYWIEECNVVFSDIAQSDQTEIAMRNAKEFLSDGGFVMISVKSQSIDVTKKPEQVYKEETSKIEKAGFRVVEMVRLEPHEQKHALLLARKQ